MLINHIDHAKIYLTLLVHKKHLEESFQLLITLAEFLFTALFVVF